MALVADELGDRLAAHAAGDVDDRLDDEAVVARGGQLVHEVAVDLQEAEGEALGVVERPEADAEVVEGDRAAERLHAFAEGARAAHVGDRGGLGDLDDQAARIDAVAGELGSMWASIPRSVTDSAERFSATLRGVPRRALARGELSAEQPGDAADDEPVDLAHQPVALGGGQERAGRDEPSVGLVGEPHERLVVGDSPSASATIGWKWSTKASFAQRAAQAREPRTRMQSGVGGQRALRRAA